MTAEQNTPQAFYSKTPSGGDMPAMPNMPAQPSMPGAKKPKSKFTFKVALAVAGLFLFAVVALVGVFISQRQRQVSGPVAPTAPTSRPSAAELVGQNCRLEFTVDAPTGVATCEDKEAFQITDENIIPLEDGAQVAKEDEFFYRITVKANQLTAGNVQFSDVLDPKLEFVEDSQNTSDLVVSVNDESAVVVAKSLGQMQPGQTETIVFKVRVLQTAEVGMIENVARVTTDGTNDNISSCSLRTSIPAVGSASCIAKEAYRLTSEGSLGDQIAANGEVSPGEEFVYRVSLSAEEQTAGMITLEDKLPENLTFVRVLQSIPAGVAMELKADTLVAEFDVLGENESAQIDFVVKLNTDAISGRLSNTATIITPSIPDSSNSCSIDLTVPSTSCNSACTTDAQCPGSYTCYENQCRLESNPTDESCQPKPNVCNDICDPNGGASECPSGQSCTSVNNEYRCRLTTNTSSASCTPADQPQCNDDCTANSQCPNDSYVCSNNKCRLATNPTDEMCRPPVASTPTPTPSPTPVLGCNATCTTNADCSNSDHICYVAGDSTGVCRLAENVESTTCTLASQPELPQELPQSGPENWGAWLKMGLITLGLGAILLLLL